MSFRFEIKVLITYIVVISLLGVIFSNAAEQGVFADSPTDEPDVNYTIFNSNWSIEKQRTVEPPICQPIIPDVNIPLLDDIGCLGSILSWINGVRGIRSSNIWFIILFIIPLAVVGAITGVRLLRGN